MPYSIPLEEEGEEIITKNVNSAFIGTDLEARLRAKGTRRLFVAGLSTDHCVSTTVRMAGNLGVVDRGEGGEEKGELVLVADATACWRKPGGEWDAEVVHAVHVESLREFAEVRSTEEVLRACGGE
jgi:nicotinamidase-related amidase